MADQIARTVLPIPDRPFTGLTTFDARDPATVFPRIEPLRPPAGAPNVLVVLLDDVGFGASSAFGGPISTPTAERLAANGLKYNKFHTTALCSPTRQALLTGRNHHSVGMGGITEIATGAAGYNSLRPNTAAPLAETLKLNGYSHRPVRQVPRGAGLADLARWVRSTTGRPAAAASSTSTASSAARPTSGPRRSTATPCRSSRSGPPRRATTSPRTSPTGRSSGSSSRRRSCPTSPSSSTSPPARPTPRTTSSRSGPTSTRASSTRAGTQLREETFARQRALGVIPPEAELTRRHDEIPAWDDMPDALKPVLIRQMEIYAGFLEHTDANVGRVIDALADLEILEDTLIYYIIGDNGASAEGTLNGTFNEMINFNGAAALETPEFMIGTARRARRADLLQPLRGRVGARPGHALPVDQAGRLPLRRHPQRHDRPLAERHPGAGARSAPSSRHVIDVAPTVLEVAGLPQPTSVHGVQQKPIEGTSMAYSFDDAAADERHDTQYFEMFGNRGIYHRGWTAVTKHKTPWLMIGEHGAGLRRRRLGALRHHRRLEPGPRPGGRGSGSAAPPATALAPGSRQVPGAADGGPARGALGSRQGRTAEPDPRQLPDALRRAWGD